MKNLKKTKYFFGIVIITFFAFTAFSSEGVVSKIKNANKKTDKSTGIHKSISLPKNVVKVKEDYQGGVFYTKSRKSEITRYKCSSCHKTQKKVMKNAANITHGDIQVVHGGKNKLECNTCHSKNDRNFLVTAKGTKVDFDHVYNLCGQCHFRQKKDWIGGAHGKRITYWAGERAVKNCTACHNPHSPLFKKRWPKTYSVPLK
ncbi:MAG: hypothetical protein GY714_12895 [Desulfobacterales bacterium]|nr:hypothetical protein [Desulfobacterales bacterium]MCP4159500.1 hypothetical protein [Deltaproteobacteria bacterium]